MNKILNLVLIVVLLIFGVVSIFLIQDGVIGKKFPIGNHLVLMGESFSKGEVFLSPFNRPTTDIVDIGGRQYLYFGPFPSLLIVPIIKLIGANWPQTYLGLASFLVSFWAVYSLSRRKKMSVSDSVWLATFFCFSTVFFGVAILGMSSYVVQAVGVALVLLAIAEYFGKKRFLLIGILLACAGLTRITLYLSVVFFILVEVKNQKRIRNFLLLAVPIAASLLLLGAYNYKRFRSPFESGYKLQSTALSYPMSKNILPGMFSLYHVPTNLYALLIQAPDPILDPRGGFMLAPPYLKANPWGMAIWFTSPLFLSLFFLKKGQNFWSTIVTVLALAFPSLIYFGIGFSQFGYRYSLDFLPFLFLLLFSSFGKELCFGHKLLIIIGVLFNCLFLASLFGVYPHFGIYG